MAFEKSMTNTFLAKVIIIVQLQPGTISQTYAACPCAHPEADALSTELQGLNLIAILLLMQ